MDENKNGAQDQRGGKGLQMIMMAWWSMNQRVLRAIYSSKRRGGKCREYDEEQGSRKTREKEKWCVEKWRGWTCVND